MHRHPKLIPAVALIGVLLFAAGGCSKVSTAEAVKFNDALVGANTRIAQAGKEFGDAAVKAIGGQPVEVAMAKRAFEKMNEAMERARADVKLLKVPDSPSARQFHDAYLSLMKTQEQLVKDDLSYPVNPGSSIGKPECWT